MSHFMTIVILKPMVNKGQIQAALDEVLEPYDEKLSVEPYEVKCSCAEYKTSRLAREHVQRTLGYNIDDLRKSFRELGPNATITWEEHTAEYVKVKGDYEKANPQPPDEDCEDCHGTGTRVTQYNPNSKWDWWRVGGRWDGDIKKNPQSSENGFNFGSQHETLENNLVTTEELLENGIVSYAIVTPEGDWIERGQMGWWGMSSNEKGEKEWDEQFKEIVSKYPGHIAVGCDMHI